MDTKLIDITTSFLDKLFEIEKQCFEQKAFTRQQLEYLISDHTNIGLMAIANGVIVGFVIARAKTRNKLTFGHILTIGVTPSYRRKGIARKMHEEIENILKERGIKESHLEVRESNFAALNLYEKLGYSQIRKLQKLYGSDNGLHLKKNL